MRSPLRLLWLVCILALGRDARAQFTPPPSPGQLPRAQQVPLSGRQPSGSVTPTEAPVAGATNSVDTLNPSINVEGAFQGSVTTGSRSAQPLALTLEDAVKRGMMYNLGTIGAGDAARAARALRLAALAQLLPDLTGGIFERVEQINLVAEGLRFNTPVPGFNFPKIIGPFNNFDARAYLNENLSLTGLHNLRASRQNARSVEFSLQDSRELVALAVSGTYLQLIASAARIQTVNAQIATAQAVYRQAVDRNRSGLNARIDVNRSQVELQTQQQRLISLTDDFEKGKIALARLIGLPMAQVFTLTDTIPYREAPAPDVDDLIQRALAGRADVKAAEAQVKAAEFVKKAASAQRYPSLDVAADYGATGINPTTSAHGTLSASAGVDFPIYRFGRTHADIEQAEAALAQRTAEYEDMKGRVEQDVRTAALDSDAAARQIRVAESNRMLAAQTLDQARDRFRAGVSDTVELVQAQESVATADQDYITALYAYNLARISLARAIGEAERGIASLLEGK